MKEVTDYILEHTRQFQRVPEVTPGGEEWSMFTDAGTENEVGEFLYSFVRMTKPELILETGTHMGVSACYMGLAMNKNNKGTLHTFEIIQQHFNTSQSIFREVGVNRVLGYLQDALQFNPVLTYDMLFLDSEPQLRFDEFIKFWPHLKPGGFILIHDLHPSLGHHGQTHHGTYDWPYGDFREKLGPYIKNYSVQTINFQTPRGLTIFQKTAPGFEVTDYLKAE